MAAASIGMDKAITRASDAFEDRLDVVRGMFAFVPVEVGPPGHAIHVKWADAEGADAVEVEAAALLVGPEVVEHPFGALTFSAGGPDYDVTIPGGAAVRSLTLEGLKLGAAELRSEGDVAAKAHRLVVTPAGAGGFGAPQFSAPAVERRGMLPLSLTGASFADKVLRLPDVAAPKIRLTLATGKFPEEFKGAASALGGVSGVAALTPRNLKLTGPDGAVVWAFPGVMPAAAPLAPVDLSHSLKQALTARLQEKSPLDVTFTLSADAYQLAGKPAGRALVSFAGVSGALVRNFPGVTRVSLAGSPTRLPLAPPDDRLADEAPASATADLTVRYEGVRILEDLSDTLPAPSEAVAGPVVGELDVIRALPPAALASLRLARVGLVGRAPEACELSLRLVDMTAGVPGGTVGEPGVVQLEPSGELGVVWVELAGAVAPPVPVAIAVRANRGRFLWAARTHPLVRLAVHDPDPGGRALRLGGRQVFSVTQDKEHRPAFALPPSLFRGAAPAFDSELFLTIDVSDLALRYRR